MKHARPFLDAAERDVLRDARIDLRRIAIAFPTGAIGRDASVAVRAIDRLLNLDLGRRGAAPARALLLDAEARQIGIAAESELERRAAYGDR